MHQVPHHPGDANGDYYYYSIYNLITMDLLTTDIWKLHTDWWHYVDLPISIIDQDLFTTDSGTTNIRV